MYGPLQGPIMQLTGYGCCLVDTSWDRWVLSTLRFGTGILCLFYQFCSSAHFLTMAVARLLGLALLLVGAASYGHGIQTGAPFRIDCFSEGESTLETISESGCESRGCIYDADTTTPRVPKCYLPQDNITGFKVISGPDNTPLGLQWKLERKTVLGIYDENIQNVTFDIELRGDDLLRFKVTYQDSTASLYTIYSISQGTYVLY